MRKFKYFHEELYGETIYYVKCAHSMYVKMVEHEFGEIIAEHPATVRASFEVYQKNGSPINVVWLSERAEIEDVMHECFHLTHHIMQYRGLILTDQSEEAYAYFMQFVFKKIKVLVR